MARGNFPNFIGANFTVYTARNRKTQNSNVNVEKIRKLGIQVELILRANHAIFLAAQGLYVRTGPGTKKQIHNFKEMFEHVNTKEKASQRFRAEYPFDRAKNKS